MLKLLVLSFNDEHGVSETGYLAAYNIIKAMLGEFAAISFKQSLTHIDYRYFFSCIEHAEECWEEMLAQSK